jgi:hypothetical protein
MDKIFFGVSVIYALTLLSLYLKDKHGYKPKHVRPDKYDMKYDYPEYFNN